MDKEMDFFLYLIEHYASSEGISADKVLKLWDEKNITGKIYDMYEMYHSEAPENAFEDIKRMLEHAGVRE